MSLRVRDLAASGCIEECYDMPQLPALLRAIKGEVELVDDPAAPIVKAIQDAIDELRTQIRPVPREEIKRVEQFKNPATWSKCLPPLEKLIIDLFQDGRNYVTMEQIREKCAAHQFLSNYLNSIGQRTRDLVAQHRIEHYIDPKTCKPVPGYYVLPQKPTIIQPQTKEVC